MNTNTQQVEFIGARISEIKVKGDATLFNTSMLK
jgi:hypothetical protein